MAAFEDFMNKFQQAYSAENFTMDEFVTAATEAYNADKTVWDSAITEKETGLTQAQQELQKARADNWKLLMGKGVNPAPSDAIGVMASGHSDDPEGSGTPTITTDDFFGTPAKKE
jgi:hypothetical protein